MRGGTGQRSSPTDGSCMLELPGALPAAGQSGVDCQVTAPDALAIWKSDPLAVWLFFPIRNPNIVDDGTHIECISACNRLRSPGCRRGKGATHSEAPRSVCCHIVPR